MPCSPIGWRRVACVTYAKDDAPIGWARLIGAVHACRDRGGVLGEGKVSHGALGQSFPRVMGAGLLLATRAGTRWSFAATFRRWRALQVPAAPARPAPRPAAPVSALPCPTRR
ncbi:hypothetical protein XFF6166_10057 [Xanthomonas citri pv. fuscans]|nr:hypothetical protein XFF6166_10057 [Xanthomonas citri pv. fuscans]SOO02330.1 hypothetical protein XFF6960_590146 [Xanthomonas citri pv. fuscans]SOO06650.1 hypothetical protein XFF7767_80058 [Xanthomonas citri pv. fuscans]SOO11227.1 hypothetical protein XFF6970_70158 [Xanthomonas citri pv. fuscans]SOO16206.1 hypothetical protein XFF7766_770058 [Xanthomonas citri pv. fuscans]